MDLLYKRYASPFVLLDGMIRMGKLADFIGEMWLLEADDASWQFYLHKVTDNISFLEFKERLEPEKPVDVVELGTAVQSSQSILQGFLPA